MTNDDLKGRVQEIMAEGMGLENVGPEFVIARLVHEAINAPTDGARVRAVELLGKGHAMFVDRSRTDPAETATPEELADAVAASVSPELRQAVRADIINRLSVLKRPVGG